MWSQLWAYPLTPRKLSLFICNIGFMNSIRLENMKSNDISWNYLTDSILDPQINENKIWHRLTTTNEGRSVCIRGGVMPRPHSIEQVGKHLFFSTIYIPQNLYRSLCGNLLYRRCESLIAASTRWLVYLGYLDHIKRRRYVWVGYKTCHMEPVIEELDQGCPSFSREGWTQKI